MEEKIIRWPELDGEPETGTWYRISPEGALCADGSPWHGNLYKGKDSRLLVYFCGGGVSVDAYTAERPEQFYFPSADRDGFELVGMPAAIGATFGRPDRKVCVFMGDGGFQMNIQELGTIMEQQAPVKMILMNNNYLGNLRPDLQPDTAPNSRCRCQFPAPSVGVSSPQTSSASVLADAVPTE